MATACGVLAPTIAVAETRHSAGFHGFGAYTGSGTRFGALSTIAGASSRLHGVRERTYVFTRGDARLSAGLRLGPDDPVSEYTATGSFAAGVQVYRVIPIALHLEDINIEVIEGDPHAHLFLGTGATIPFDVLFDLSRETVLIGSVVGGGWINEPGAGNDYLAGGARIDFLSDHVGAQASSLHLIDNAAHRQQLQLFVRDLWAQPVRLGFDYERASSGSQAWMGYFAWGIAP